METLEVNVALQRGSKLLSVWINLLGLIALNSVDRVGTVSALTNFFPQVMKVKDSKGGGNH